MLFEKLYVENLGVFKGEHSLELLPPDPQKPIVLVGALNGSGKTTVIEAFQLALYGKRAIYGWRGAASYSQYLEQVRNRHATPVEMTVAEVTMRLSDGRHLRVRRQWSFAKDLPREYVSVFADHSEEPDRALSDSWDDEIERLLPARLAELFFFDGERIERLADPIKGAEVLRSAVSSLLGLDLVDHLVADLEIMRSRQKQKLLSDLDRAELTAIETEQQVVAQQLEDVRDRKAACNNRIARARAELDDVSRALQAAGGDRFANRERLAAEKADASSRVMSEERALRACAAGSLPLILIKGRLEAVLTDAKVKALKPDPNALELVETQLGEFARWANKRPYPAAVKSEITNRIAAQLKTLSTDALSPSDVNWRALCARLSTLLDHDLGASHDKTTATISEIRNLVEAIHKLDEHLAHVPEHEQIVNWLHKQGAAAAVAEEAELEISTLEREESAHVRRAAQLMKKKLLQLNKVVDASDASRLADYCQRSIRTLTNYRSDLVRVRREQLEKFILEAFQLLSRKRDLIGRVTLNPETMAISLQSSDGDAIVTQQLSAGERQLLAVAMLWGLARASGRPVPVVIDTPLGRLDGEHRRAIVERYFPDAGHQVILLSTDTEVDAEFSSLLDESVSHRYLIGYDAKARSSSFVPGYFER